METNESIEIPFGAKDSELKGWEYTIPEGMEAVIKDGKIIVREKESEDEKIRKELLAHIQQERASSTLKVNHAKWDKMIAWLEKQGEQNPAWSEEDESWFKEIELMALSFSNDESYRKMFFEWLKSLKDRYTWKPSDEQINGIKCAIETLRHQLNIGDKRLDSLYNDLKKLKG